LADNFIKALREEFFSDWADAALPGLALHKFLVEHFSKSSDIDPAGGLMTHILDPLLAYTLKKSKDVKENSN